MTELKPPEHKRDVRRFAANGGAMYRLQEGTITVEDSDHVERFKELGFTEVGGESDDADTDLSELTHDELKARAEAEGIAGEIDLRSKGAILEALQERQ